MAWYEEEHYEAPVSESLFHPERLEHLRCHQILRYNYPRRTAVPRGFLRVLGTLALPVLGTLKGTLRVPKGILRVPKGILRVPFY